MSADDGSGQIAALTGGEQSTQSPLAAEMYAAETFDHLMTHSS